MKHFIIPILVTIISYQLAMAQSKAKLLYFADPMCSWCYGFTPEFSQIIDSLGDELEIQLVMGGLRPYNTETMQDLGNFLKNHWQHVQEASGQPFKYDILRNNSFVYDTEPSCRAVVTVRKLWPESTFKFFRVLQEAFYAENMDTNDTEVFVSLVGAMGKDKVLFRKEFESEVMRRAVRADFSFSADLGVRGFPTVVLHDGDQFFLVADGYAKAEVVIRRCREKLLVGKAQ